MQKRLAFLIAVSICALPLAAQAQRKSPLADAPAIRKRFELRSSRLEVGAGAGTTLGQDFYHSVLIDVKLGFHVTDWLSIAAVGGFALANIDTGFKDSVVNSLDPSSTTRAPGRNEATGSMNKLSQMLGAQLELTPFTGKYSMFGKLFAHYDFYLFAGPGALNYTATDSSVGACPDTAAPTPQTIPITRPTPCAVTGYKIGVNTGVGIHSFINHFVALNFELRDVVSPNNASGRDVNGDGKIDNGDLSWGSTFIATLNVVLYLPSSPDISN